MDPIYIIGHKNPDLDAICAPLAYAAFKEAMGESGFVAARCGNTNARIDAVLQHFGAQPPLFIGDVTPRVKDIMVSPVHHVRLDSTCFQALELIDQFDVRALPVVDAEGKVKGIVSIFDLGQYFVPKPRDPRLVRRVKTSVSGIVSALKATVHHIAHPDDHEELFVRIGAMDIQSFGPVSIMQHTPSEQTIVLVGDRLDIQQKAIEMGIRLVVITSGWPVDSTIIASAKAKGVSFITSPYDSATTAWIIRAAEQVNAVMQTDVVTCDAEEKLIQARRKVASSPVSTVAVVDDNQRLVGVFSKSDLVKPTTTQLVLIDHNELTQAVDGAGEVQIIEIIDHHRLGNPSTQQAILFRNEPVGSSCTIVAELFRREGLTPSRTIAGLMMGGLVSDTLNLRGPTSTKRDEAILRWLEPIAGITGTELSNLIFSSGSVILTQTPEAVVCSDCKVYDEGKRRYAVAQVEELGLENFWSCADSLLQALDAFCKQEKLFFAALLVTDINTQNSVLLLKGDSEFIEHISYPALEKEGIFDLPGIVSRKKQLVPYLTGVLTELDRI